MGRLGRKVRYIGRSCLLRFHNQQKVSNRGKYRAAEAANKFSLLASMLCCFKTLTHQSAHSPAGVEN